MKEIELNEQSKAAKWYKFFYGIDHFKRNMPKDTCTYYRNSIISWFLAPFAIVGIIFSTLTKVKSAWFEKIIATIVFIILPLIFGISFVKDTTNENNFLLMWFYGLLALLGIFVIVAIFLFIIFKIDDLKDKYVSSKTLSKEPGIIKSWYTQLKDKTCSKIQWK